MDLQSVQPDAAVVSFYKVLGLPTGVGALLVRKSFLSRLSKDRFAGGTVKMVTADEYVLRSGHERFEEGTPNFGSIPLLKFVLDFIEKIGGIDAIGRHVQHLTTELLKGLNDVENVQIYGPRTMESRGGTISLNVLRSGDECVPHREIVEAAGESNISLRGGCFCNPIVGAKALGLGSEEGGRLIQLAREADEIEMPGAVRLSLGLANTSSDIVRIIEFVRRVARKY